MEELGSRGRLNFFWDPMAAGKGGAENMAATTLMRVIQECICSELLGGERESEPVSSVQLVSGLQFMSHATKGATSRETATGATSFLEGLPPRTAVASWVRALGRGEGGKRQLHLCGLFCLLGVMCRLSMVLRGCSTQRSPWGSPGLNEGQCLGSGTA